MSYFPLFADLNHRKVLVVGAGTVAERKITALLKAQAQVYIVAQKLNPQIQTWVEQQRVHYLGEQFEESQLLPVFLVIAASNDRSLNQQVYACAERHAKFCNTVDDKALCSYIMPSIVDRDPLQIAISSAGSAPVLAKQLRQQLETTLPAQLGQAACIAQQWRDKVKQQLPDEQQRRLFWEQLFASSFTTLASSGQADKAQALLAQRLDHPDHRESGLVTLVGAGPGDPGLLTLNALQAMQKADVVLHDALISPEILELVRRDAKRINVGKRAGAHLSKQEEINQLLVQYAQQGLNVVRLKGGDPFVFGRGGEECETLVAHGINFRIVPGVTAALGATAYAGIPLTHRDYAQTVQFITGHLKGDHAQVSWKCLARSQQTLVIYMGTLKSEILSKELIAHGRDADTPVALVSHGTMAKQHVTVGTLQTLPQLAQQAQRPTLIIIGEVVKLRQTIQWFQP
ncbi:siroheme synthase CysG [Brackiella oedipodis]|uniref:siroheme synthase CysG n=1 Tax=Brackiella oedipodis TaxID=124225 RepID=UPI00048E928B|nr:siroheme synthase CysG [Brackiella oedipodis]